MASTSTTRGGTRKVAAAEVAKVVKVSASDNAVTTSSSKPVTRREVLIRQPSYCKILDDLKGTEAKVASNLKQETTTTTAVEATTTAETMEVNATESSEESNETLSPQQVQTITINGQQYQIVNALGGVDGVQAITVGAGGVVTSGSPSSGVVQYAASTQNGQTVFIPGTVAAATSQATPQIISVASASSTPSGSGGGASSPPGSSIEEATRKREIRLLKNREAARECRNKKKEYIKCLENRVGRFSIFGNITSSFNPYLYLAAILENQNKALIEELKNLKELYTGQKS